MKRIANRILISVFLLIIYSTIVHAACVVPYENMQITKDTTLCAGTYYLNDSGKVNIKVIGDNIILNCNNTIIKGDYRTNFTKGISLVGNNITLKNCNIQGYSNCVSLTNYNIDPIKMMENSSIVNNNFSRCDGLAGIFIDGQNNFNISNNRFVDFDDYYERSIGSHAIYISSFNQFQSPQGGRVYNNYISNISSSAIKLNGKGTIRNILIYNNIISDIYRSQSDDIGIHLADTENISIFNNKFIGEYGAGIVLSSGYNPSYYAINNNIYNNTFNDLTVGIWFRNGTNNNYIHHNIYFSNKQDFMIQPTANFKIYELNPLTIGAGWNKYLAHLNFSGSKNFTINSNILTMHNNANQWSPFNDIKDSSTGEILASNINTFSITLNPNQKIEVGNFVNDPINTITLDPITVQTLTTNNINISVYLSSIDSTINSDITCNYDVSGNDIITVVEWYRNNAFYIRGINTIKSSILSNGDVWYCVVNVTDPYNQAFKSSNNVVIGTVAKETTVKSSGGSSKSSGGVAYVAPNETITPTPIEIKTFPITLSQNSEVLSTNNSVEQTKEVLLEQPEEIKSATPIYLYAAIIILASLTTVLVTKKTVKKDVTLQKFIEQSLYAGYTKEAITTALKSHYNKSFIQHHLVGEPTIRYNNPVPDSVIYTETTINQLKEYIRHQRQQDFKDEDIKEALLHYGYSRKILEEII